MADLSDPMVLGAIAAAVVGLLLIVVMFGGGGGKKKFLIGKGTRQTMKLGERVNLSHDVVRFRFTLPESTPVLGLPVGRHITLYGRNSDGKVKGKWNGQDDLASGEAEISRPYTPSSSDDEVGYVDFVIKVYKGGVIDRFPDGGKMSQYMDTLKVGDTIDCEGPVGMHTYLGKGKFASGMKGREKFHTCKKVGMMAGGTGITPMLQVIAAILKDPNDTTEISLLYANQTEDDILVRDMLEDLQKKHPKQFKLWYTVDRPPAKWAYSSGFITDTMIAEHLPGPEEDTLILMCGPPPMVKFACKANLDKLGYPASKQVAF
jgi:cytochrome-b5 reductase